MRARTARRLRAGAAVVEMAAALPVLMALVFGLFEYGRAQMVVNLLKNACRKGARQGSLEGVTTAQVKDLIRDQMAMAFDPSLVTIEVKEADIWDQAGAVPTTPAGYSALPNAELDGFESRKLFLVRATVDYNAVALLKLPSFTGITLVGQSIMRHE